MSKYYENQNLEYCKSAIKQSCNDTTASFVKIGYFLKQVRDRELYIEDGYQDIWQFAEQEFGISKSTASRFMGINDRFSVDGNSPDLLPEWTGFSSSKLSEMLTLSEKQLEEVKPETTIKQIREMKPSKPKKEKVEEPRKEIHKEQLKELDGAYRYSLFANCFGYDHLPKMDELRDKILEGITADANGSLMNFEMVLRANLPIEEGRFTVCFEKLLVTVIDHGIDSKAAYSVYDAMILFRDNLKQFSKSIATSQQTETSIDKLDFSISTYNTLRRAGISTVEELREKTEDELITIRNLGKRQLGEIHEKLKCVTESAEDVSENQESVINEPGNITKSHHCEAFGYECNLDERRWLAEDAGLNCTAECCCSCNEVSECGCRCFVATDKIYKQDQEVIVDAEYQEVNTKAPVIKGFMDDAYCPSCKKSLIYRCNCECGQVIDWTSVASFFEYEEEQIQKRINEKVEQQLSESALEKQEQPELPKLTNNDKRKEWIEQYRTWPLWFEIEQTGERYFKYDFKDGSTFVVKESLAHIFENYKPTDKTDYNHKEYYHIGRSGEWGGWKNIKNLTFYESQTNISSMIDYLKEMQKGDK